MLDITSTQLPDRKNVELNIEHSTNGITITSDYDNVNTSLAYHDIFESEQWLGKKNNLTYVKAGVTNITFKVPYLWQGALVSVAGLVLTVAWMVILCIGEKKRKLSPASVEEIELIEIDTEE